MAVLLAHFIFSFHIVHTGNFHFQLEIIRDFTSEILPLSHPVHKGGCAAVEHHTMQATSLHDFPAELLRQVAELTHHQPSQQALRSSSKVLRDALNPRIRACTVDVTNSDAQDCSGDECAARVQAGMKQLARFPAACTLTSLSWGLDDWAAERSDEEDDYYYEHSEPDPQQVLAASILCQQVRCAWHGALHGSHGPTARPKLPRHISRAVRAVPSSWSSHV